MIKKVFFMIIFFFVYKQFPKILLFLEFTLHFVRKKVKTSKIETSRKKSRCLNVSTYYC